MTSPRPPRDVTFVSEWNHYAWPYVGTHSKFDVKIGGGTIVNSSGGINEQGTHEKRALWVDCSNRVDGVTAGLAVFSRLTDARFRLIRPGANLE